MRVYSRMWRRRSAGDRTARSSPHLEGLQGIEGFAELIAVTKLPHETVNFGGIWHKALYVNVAHTLRFAGMTDDESRPLLRYLFEHSVRPEFTCRFRWRTGSLALWDNRCALHFPINDYHGHRRTMHRITLAGDVPR